MADLVLNIFNLLGALFFLLAGIYGLKNYRLTYEISNFWQVFSISSFLAFAWALSVTIEWLGIYPDIIDVAQQSLIAASITAFAIAALLTSNSIIRPTQ